MHIGPLMIDMSCDFEGIHAYVSLENQGNM
jgi:hypothetical protein